MTETPFARIYLGLTLTRSPTHHRQSWRTTMIRQMWYAHLVSGIKCDFLNAPTRFHMSTLTWGCFHRTKSTSVFKKKGLWTTIMTWNIGSFHFRLQRAPHITRKSKEIIGLKPSSR